MSEATTPQYSEEVESLDINEAIREAKRCLNCKNPQCKKGCPISNDIPEFISAISQGNMGEARDIIAQKSNLPAVCGRVCPHELQCEGGCVLGKKGETIRIGLLERFVADFAFQMRLTNDKITAKTRGRVGVIGSGPAGLTVAGDLSKLGFSVTVFEALPEAGGVLLYGIPAFRLPKEVVRREILQMEAHGVNFITNATAGKDFTVDSLFESGFDAVFIGSGTAVAKDLDIEGKELAGIVQSSYFLRMISLFNSGQVEQKEVPVEKGDVILIIGCGNVAMDAARSALRLGAKSVTVLSRDMQEKMPALKSEYEAAVNDGTAFLWEHSPVAYVGENGNITGLKVTTPNGGKILTASKVFLAIGARPANRIVSTTEGIDVDETGYVITKERPYGMTTRKGVFAGGDVVHKPATVVLAMKEAKKVAEGISSYVDAVKLLEL